MGSNSCAISLEAHGTGTALGDPIEVGAAIAVLSGSSSMVNGCTIKSNMGHLEAAAAVAGFTSLVYLPLNSLLNNTCCSLRIINAHLRSLKLGVFRFSAEVAPAMSNLAKG